MSEKYDIPYVLITGNNAAVLISSITTTIIMTAIILAGRSFLLPFLVHLTMSSMPLPLSAENIIDEIINVIMHRNILIFLYSIKR